MSRDELDDDIRAALRRRAAQAPVGVRPTTRPVRRAYRPTRALLAAGFAVVALTLVAVALQAGDEPARVASGEAPSTVVPPGAHLAFDPGFHYLRVDENPCPIRHAPTARPSNVRLQSFGTSLYASPLLFVQTIPKFGPASSFGLLTASTGEPIKIRGVDGYATPVRDGSKYWYASAVLPDGDAIFVVGLGLGFDDALPIIDGLHRQPGEPWTLATAPTGWHELPASEPAQGCGYSASSDRFEVNLYVDPFDSRLQDRVASTTGPVEQVELAGLPAAMGAYSAKDHWVLAEPAPGQTLEIRAQGTKAELLALLHRARFTDDAGWREARPEGTTTTIPGTESHQSEASTTTAP